MNKDVMWVELNDKWEGLFFSLKQIYLVPCRYVPSFVKKEPVILKISYKELSVTVGESAHKPLALALALALAKTLSHPIWSTLIFQLGSSVAHHQCSWVVFFCKFAGNGA